MGEIIPFPSARRFDKDRFLQKTNSDELGVRVIQSFSDMLLLTPKTRRDISLNLPVITPKEGMDLKYGFCFVLPLKGLGESRLVTSFGFPKALHEEFGLEESKSLELAAAYSAALWLIEMRKTNLFKYMEPQQFRLTINKSFEQVLWKGLELNGFTELSYRQIVQNRAAGTVAIKATGSSLEMVESGSFPPHIAALVNPIPVDKFRFLNSVLK